MINPDFIYSVNKEFINETKSIVARNYHIEFQKHRDLIFLQRYIEGNELYKGLTQNSSDDESINIAKKAVGLITKGEDFQFTTEDINLIENNDYLKKLLDKIPQIKEKIDNFKSQNLESKNI